MRPKKTSLSSTKTQAQTNNKPNDMWWYFISVVALNFSTSISQETICLSTQQKHKHEHKSKYSLFKKKKGDETGK